VWCAGARAQHVGGFGSTPAISFFADCEHVLYFKVDDVNREDYEARGLGRSGPMGNDRDTMQYYEVPATCSRTQSSWAVGRESHRNRPPQKRRSEYTGATYVDHPPPSLRAIWERQIVLGVVGYLATRFRRWLVLRLALVGLAAWTQLGELLDPQWVQASGTSRRLGQRVALAVLFGVLGLVPKRTV